MTKSLCIFCPHPETLWEAEFKGDLVEEISRQSSIQSAAWVWLTAFSQTYSENGNRKSEQKHLENF
jgi:hypothetical protein